MECPKCGKNTKVVRCHTVNGQRVSERVCEDGHKLVFVTRFVHQIERRGQGAYATAKRIANGEEV